MASKTFLTISKAECLIVYKEVLDNSQKKWEAGKALAIVGEYGSATSLAIISIEEIIKALIIFFDGKGFEFRRVKGMDAIFNHHQLRYLLAYVMFIINLGSDEIMKYLQKTRNNPEMVIKLHEELKSDENFFERKFKTYLLRKLVILRKEFEWFSKVDIFRQDGFYCDYEEQFKNPINITEETYDEVIKRLDKVRRVATGIISSFNSDEEAVKNQLIYLRKDFKQKAHYNKIAVVLSKVRQTRQSPFDLLKNSFLE